MQQNRRFSKLYDENFDNLFQDLWAHRLYSWLIRHATHREYEYNGMLLKPGHYVRSVSKLVNDLAYKEKNALKKPGRASVDRAIKELEERGLILTEYPIKSVFCGTSSGTDSGTGYGTLFTVVEMQSYQGFDDSEKDSCGTSSGTDSGISCGNKTRINKQELNNNNMSSRLDNAFPFAEIISYLNECCGTKYKASTKATQKHIKARMNEGFTLDDFKRVIDIKRAEWIGTDMEKYLRPETLFGTKFESYLNQQPKAASRQETGSGQTPVTRQPTDFTQIYNEGDW